MTDIQTNQRQKNQIYWHKKDIKIELETWSSDEVKDSLSYNTIHAPGPKTEPPFEVKVLSSRFLYEGKKESTVYLIRISSLLHSWLLLKDFQEILHLINTIRDNSDIIDRLNMKRFKSITADAYGERVLLIELILSTLLNNSTYYRYIQHFILTNTITDTDCPRKIADYLEREKKDAVCLVEQTGWMSKWRVRQFILLNNMIIYLSITTGRIKSVISIQDIRIVDRTVRIKERVFLAQDTKTVDIIKRWMHRCIV